MTICKMCGEQEAYRKIPDPNKMNEHQDYEDDWWDVCVGCHGFILWGPKIGNEYTLEEVNAKIEAFVAKGGIPL